MSRLVFRRPMVCLIIGGEFELETRQLAGLWPVSALTLGGGGVGQLWGETTRDECVAAVRAAMDSGITLLDMAPRYGDGEAELVVGEAFDAKLPEGVRVSTEHRLGTPAPGEVEDNLISSLEESLERMRLDRVDLFFLHSNIIPDDYDASAYTDRPATRWKIYAEQIVPGVLPASVSPLVSWRRSTKTKSLRPCNVSPTCSTRRATCNISMGQAGRATSSLKQITQVPVCSVSDRCKEVP